MGQISIPYGAIKSNTTTPSVYKFIQFQFLMVRLKENIENEIYNVKANFNSLWCD